MCVGERQKQVGEELSWWPCLHLWNTLLRPPRWPALPGQWADSWSLLPPTSQDLLVPSAQSHACSAPRHLLPSLCPLTASGLPSLALCRLLAKSLLLLSHLSVTFLWMLKALVVQQ